MRLAALAAAAALLAAGAGPAAAADDDDAPMMRPGAGPMMQGGYHRGEDGYRRHRMWHDDGYRRDRRGGQGMPMMGRGFGTMMSGPMLTMVFVLADTYASGTLSLEEVLAVEERFFHRIDADGDGEMTMQEMRGFMREMMDPRAAMPGEGDDDE